MTLIKCKNLTLGYEGKVVVNNISFSVEDGDYLCIVGENGSGKSTLMNGILRAKNPIDGFVIYNSNLNNTEVGFLPQQSEHLSDFPASVYEVVVSGRINSMGLRPFYNKSDKKVAEENMRLLNISDIRHMRFTDLSGGQKQRVLLARALCATKRLLMLDEPASGLDPKITAELYSLIDRINKEKRITVIMVSHDVNSAVKYANKILHLGDSEYFYGTTEEYLVSEIGKRFFERK